MSEKGLEQKVGALEADVHNINRNLSQLTTAVHNLTDKISMNQKTDWAVLGAWATVIIAILGGLGYLTTKPMEYDLRVVEQRFYAHESQGGHQEMSIRMNALEKRVDELRQETLDIRQEQMNRTGRVYRGKK